MEAGKAKERVEIVRKRKWVLSLCTVIFTGLFVGLFVGLCADRVFINSSALGGSILAPMLCLTVALSSWDHSQTIKAYEALIRSKRRESKGSD